jgi:hypothetical protein
MGVMLETKGNYMNPEQEAVPLAKSAARKPYEKAILTILGRLEELTGKPS